MAVSFSISIVSDNPRSWYARHAASLAEDLTSRGHTVRLISDPNDLTPGDIAFFLSCEQIISESLLARNTHNIVAHAADVPLGRGWSPMTWQILEGKSDIVVSLFEAAKDVDSGDVFDREHLHLEGHELIVEAREKEAAAIRTLVLRFVDSYPRVVGVKQSGEATYYRRRTPEDSALDPTKTLAEQFDLLRVVDNERYPAFFRLGGHTYILKIEKKD